MGFAAQAYSNAIKKVPLSRRESMCLVGNFRYNVLLSCSNATRFIFISQNLGSMLAFLSLGAGLEISTKRLKHRW